MLLWVDSIAAATLSQRGASFLYVMLVPCGFWSVIILTSDNILSDDGWFLHEKE